MVLAFPAAMPAASLPWTLDHKTIAILESVAKVPGGYGHAPIPLEKYARYYVGVVINGRRMIRGEFDFPNGPDGRRAGVYIVGESGLPHTLDGGCSIVNLIYDPEAHKMVSIVCNGVA